MRIYEASEKYRITPNRILNAIHDKRLPATRSDDWIGVYEFAEDDLKRILYKSTRVRHSGRKVEVLVTADLKTRVVKTMHFQTYGGASEAAEFLLKMNPDWKRA